MENQNPEIPKSHRFILKFIKPIIWGLSTLLILVGLLLGLVFIYEDEVKQAIIEKLNQHLNAEIRVDAKNIDLTIIRSFPSTAIDFKDLTCFEPGTSKNRDTLFQAGRISLQFNVMDLFYGKYNINQIDLNQIRLRLKVDKNGHENYIIWKTNNEKSNNQKVSFQLERVNLKNIKFYYRNLQNNTSIDLNMQQADFSGKFNESAYALTSEGEFLANRFKFKGVNYLKNKNVIYAIRLDVNKNTYKIEKSELKINEVNIALKGMIENQSDILHANLTFSAQNLDVQNTLSLLPESQKKRLSDYEGEGTFYLHGSVSGPLNSNDSPDIQANFGVKKASLKYKPSDLKAEQISFTGSYVNRMGNEELVLDDIHAVLNANYIRGRYRMINFNDPYIDTRFNVNANLKELLAFYPIDTITEIQGALKLDAEIKGKLANLKSDFTDVSNYSKGHAELNGVNISFKHDKNKWNIPSGKFSLENNNIIAEDLLLKIGTSDLELKGELINFVPWLLKENQKLMVEAQCHAKYILLDELIFSPETSSDKNFELPENLSFQLNTSIDKIQLGKFTAQNLSGEIGLRDKKVFGEQISCDAMGGKIYLSGILEECINEIKIKGEAKLNDIDVKTMMYEMNNFSQNEILDKHVKGKGDFSLDFSSEWDKKWNCDLSKLLASFDLQLEKGELTGYKPLEKLGKFIELKELQQIRFNTLKSHLEIKNRQIEISRTNISSSAINLEFHGTHSFENKIDYHIKLLLSDLLAKRPGKNKELDEELSYTEQDPANNRCVFLSMKGDINNPVISYDRKAMKEKIKDDIKKEKQNLKSILKEEFGFFKRDTSVKTPVEEKKKQQKFLIDNGTKKTESTQNKLSPKKPKDKDDEDF